MDEQMDEYLFMFWGFLKYRVCICTDFKSYIFALTHVLLVGLWVCMVIVGWRYALRSE